MLPRRSAYVSFSDHTPLRSTRVHLCPCLSEHSFVSQSVDFRPSRPHRGPGRPSLYVATRGHTTTSYPPPPPPTHSKLSPSRLPRNHVLSHILLTAPPHRIHTPFPPPISHHTPPLIYISPTSHSPACERDGVAERPDLVAPAAHVVADARDVEVERRR